MRCLQYKIDFVEADINKGFHQILQTWMVKRAKMGNRRGNYSNYKYLQVITTITTIATIATIATINS